MGQYLPVVALLVLAVLFGALSFGASRLLAPRRPSAAKTAPYECGIVPSRETPERFPVTFYVVAMLFIMFDIELIFIYPFAVDRQFLGTYAFWEMVAFSVVFFGAFYLINLMLAVVAMSYDDEAGVTNQVGSVFSFPFSRTSCLRSIIQSN